MSMTSDISGATPTPLSAIVPSPDPVQPPIAGAGTGHETVKSEHEVSETLKPFLTDLSGVLSSVALDLSGVEVDGAILLRYLPRLAAAVNDKPLSGAQKRDLVIGACHILVDRLVPVDQRADAHTLLTKVAPPAIAAVIDVAHGRVTFAAAAQSVATAAAPVVLEVAQRQCLPHLLAWFQSLLQRSKTAK